MTLTLRILTHARLENGRPIELVLRNRGAIIGRGATCEWPLPDETGTLSRRHCEIQYRQDDYFILDHSTNGTFLGDSPEPLGQPHKVAPGDRFRLGEYVIEARLSGPALDRHNSLVDQQESARRGPGYSDWNDVPGSRPAAQAPSSPGFADDGGWELEGEAPKKSSHWSEDTGRASQDRSADDIFSNFAESNKVDWASVSWDVESKADPFASGPQSDGENGFAPLNPKPADPGASFPPAGSVPARSTPTNPEPGGDPFGGPLDQSQSAAPSPPPASPTPAPSASDPFGGPLNGNDPQAAPPSTPSSDPFGGPLSPDADPAAASVSGTDPFGGPLNPANGLGRQDGPGAEPVSAPPQIPEDTTTPPGQVPAASGVPPSTGVPDAAFHALLGAMGVAPDQMKVAPEDAAAQAGRMLRHLLAGLMTLLEARARAKDEMGASATQLRFDGNNPLKFARNIDQALQMMLNPAMRGYMGSEQAIEDSYRDLQAHQIATLKAMQGALKATVEMFSPAAMKERTESSGLLEKVMPGQRDAALWKAYEKQFSGVAEGSAEAFLEVFSKEFREAYEDAVQAD